MNAFLRDCFGILPDDKIRKYIELGCEVKGMGRGHIKRLKDAVVRGGKAKQIRSKSVK